MALISCKKCGCQMSDKSEACPICGTPVEANVDEHIKTQEVETIPHPLEPTTQQNNNKVPQKKQPDAVSVENNPPTSPPPTHSHAKPEQPKIKSKTGLILGVVLAVVLVIAVATFFMLNNKMQKRLLAEKEAYYEQQLAEQQRIQEEQQALYEAELEAQKTQLEEQPIRVYSNAYDGFVNIRQEPQSKSPILGVLKNGPEGAILLGTEGEWKKIDCNGIVGYVYEKYVQDTPTEVFEYWGMLRKDASNYRFTENDLSPLTAKELTYLRNSVYAKHGYVFDSQELNNYFKRISWYHPDASVTEAALNSVERANVEFIKNYQERNGKTYKPQ